MKTRGLIFVLIAIVALVSCNKDEGSNNNPNGSKATLSVKMVDNPGAYDAVNIDVVGLNVNYNGQWTEFPLESPGIYNLLSLTNGNSLLLIGDTALAPGSVTEIRLLLGVNNSVIVNGLPFELQTPSGQSSGYKVKMDAQVLEAGRTYALVLDFDVNRSVHVTGNGKFMLNPVVHGFLETAVGQIAGEITPAGAALYVQAYNDADTVGTYIDSLSGEFLFGAVLPGLYHVTFTATGNYSDTTVIGVPVVAGEITQMGTIELHAGE